MSSQMGLVVSSRDGGPYESPGASEDQTVEGIDLNSRTTSEQSADRRSQIESPILQEDRSDAGVHALRSLLEVRERQLAERESRFREIFAERELAAALAGRPLIPGAAMQLMKLWRDELVVLEEEGRYRVLTVEGREIGRAVDEWLGRQEYAHFCHPKTRGGAASSPAEIAITHGGLNSSVTLIGHSIVRNWHEQNALKRSEEQPIGLRRTRPYR